MKEELVIIRAGIADADIITALSVETFTETFAQDNDPADMQQYLSEDMSLERLTKELGDPANYFFLATYNSTPAGYAKVRGTKIPLELKGRRALEVERIYVLKAYHGKKVGAALMEQCLEHAKKHNHDVVWLGVWERNYKAINFYKQWGFELFGSHVFRLGKDEQTDVLMKKELACK